MRSSLFAIAGLVAAVSAQGIQPAPSSTVVAAAGSLPLGAECATTEQCANGADCFASTAWQIKSCGKFNSACDNDSQCATNTCQNGLCNGFLASSAYLANSASATATSSSSSAAAPSATADDSVPLGSRCTATRQCASGATCAISKASQDPQYPVCGAFGVICSTDDQCATNTCVSGLCNGYKGGLSSTTTSVSSSSSSIPSSTVVAAAGSLALGKECANSKQCANGAQCAASGAYQDSQVPVCGAYKAVCSSDDQCATNTCAQGLCQGYKGGVTSTLSSVVAAGSGVSSSVAVGSVNGTRVNTTASATPSAYTGGAGKSVGVEATFAVVLGVVAWFL